MKKCIRTVFTCLCLVALIVSMATVVFATEATFSSKYIDSNEWTYVTSGKKATRTSTADLKITALYEADGSTSDYWRIYAKATSVGTKTYVEKGSYYAISIPSSYQAGYVSLYLMGPLPSLDCRGRGNWVIH